MNINIIGDFDFSITEVELAHKLHYSANYKYDNYKDGRKISGVVYCIAGSAEFIFNNSIEVIKKGELMFLSEDLAYTMKAKEEFHHITINFHLANNDCKKLKAGGYIGGLPYKISADLIGGNGRMEEILTIWECKKVGFRVKIKAMLYELLYDYFVFIKSKNQPNDYIKVRPAKHILDARYCENISVAELACACGFTESYFRHTFLKVFNCSPTKYKLEKRLLKAKDLLLAGEMTVNEVAMAVGFDDANYFSRIFKAHEHITPSRYGK